MGMHTYYGSGTDGAWCRGEYVHHYALLFLEKMPAPVRITIIYVGMGRLHI